MIDFEILGQLQIIVKLAPSLKKFVGRKSKELKGFLLEYLNDLIVDLRLPLKILLEINSDNEEDKYLCNFYQIFINDQRCRLEAAMLESINLKIVELARTIANSVFENRALFLTEELSKEIQKNWLKKYNKDFLNKLSNKEFHNILLTVIHRCLGINRVEDFIKNVKDEHIEWSTAKIFEEGIFTLKSITISIFLNKRKYSSVIFKNHEEESLTITKTEKIEDMLSLMKDGLFYELGIYLPEVNLDIDDHLKDNEFRIQINDLRLPTLVGLEQDQFIVNELPERLCLLGLKGEKAINPANRCEVSKIQNVENSVKICEEAGLTTWNPEGYIILTLSSMIRKNASNFLNEDIVNFSLDTFKLAFPKISEAALNFLNMLELTCILRELLEEELSIRDYRSILEALIYIKVSNELERKNSNISILDTIELLRISLKKYISDKYKKNQNTLVVYLLDHQIETRINSGFDLSSKEHDRLIKSIFKEVGISIKYSTPVLLTSLKVRKKLRKLIEKEFPWLPVLSYEELAFELNIQPIGQISWI